MFPWLSSTRRTRRGASEDYLGASEDDATDEDDSGSNDGDGEDSASSTEDEDATMLDPYYQDALLRLASFLVTEPFRDGQARSTLLVYFSGVERACPSRNGSVTRKLASR